MTSKYLLFILLFLALVSCKSTQTQIKSGTIKPPAQFAGDHTYANDSVLHWKSFFKDERLLAWLDSGLRNNQDVKQTFARISLASADVKLARGNFLPQLNLTTAAGMQRFGDYTVDGVGNFDTNLSDNITPDRRIPEHIPDLYLGFQAQWEADIWGKLKNRKKAAVARYLSSAQAWNDSRLLLLYHIAERYYQLQTLDYKLKMTRENELLQVRALELIRAQKQAGVVTELAVKQFEAQTLNTKALAFNLQREIRQVEYEFNLLTGTMPAPVERTSLSITDQFLKVNTLITPDQILKIRPDVRQAEWEIAAAGADVAAARAAFYPSLNFSATPGLHTFRSSVWFQFPISLAYWFGGSLATPLLQRNALKAELNAAKTKESISILKYESTIIKAIGEVQLFLDTRAMVANSFSLKNEEVNALNSGLSASRDLFIAGMATYLEVITAQKSVLEAQLDLADINLLQAKNELNLYRSLGFGNLR
jgi:multidrug efflux system outer membrane protein